MDRESRYKAGFFFLKFEFWSKGKGSATERHEFSKKGLEYALSILNYEVWTWE